MNFKAIILAAGKGTRMKSKLPKVVHKVCGKEMVNHVINVSKKSGVSEIIAILGHGSEVVEQTLPQDTKIAMQTEQLGTGHAVMMAKGWFEAAYNNIERAIHSGGFFVSSPLHFTLYTLHHQLRP